MNELMRRAVGDCDETWNRLSDYLDRELTRPQRIRVGMHLAGCKACRQVARTLQRTVARLRALGGATAPAANPAIVGTVVRRIGEERDGAREP